jgi:flagellar hook assembly protein FlgD
VKTLAEGKQPAGYYETQWNGTNEDGNPVAGGLYICQLKADDFLKANKMVLIR